MLSDVLHPERHFASDVVRRDFISTSKGNEFDALEDRNYSEMTSRTIFIGVNRLCVLLILKG